MGSIPDRPPMNVKSVCIIGAGPSGLAAAKYLLAERTFSHIVLFEQRSTVGGLWNHVSCPDAALQEQPVPQTSPYAGLEKPRWIHHDCDKKTDGAENGTPEFQSPIYDRLETNIPRDLMGFSDLNWPEDCQLFPRHEEALAYIERYAEDVMDLIRFETQVVDVSLSIDERWLVKTRPMLQTSETTVEEHTFDAVLVANGHFNVPSIPPVPGIEAWNQAHPGIITHSKFYRKPEDYADQKVLVIGTGPSGIDIAFQIGGFCKSPLLLSQKSESYMDPDASCMMKPEIEEYIVQDRAVRFKDGTVESNINAIVYCTGYFYSFPFLNSLDPPVISSGECVDNTYQHVFYRPHPTLAFAVLNQKVIPFPVAEAQAAVVARVWSGQLQLPSDSDMREWEQKQLEDTGGGRHFHVLKFPKDADYINNLHAWSRKAEHKVGTHEQREILNGDETYDKPQRDKTSGKEPPYWTEKEYWTRERFPAIKKAFQSFGEERHTKRQLEDVGFDFEAWKKGQSVPT